VLDWTLSRLARSRRVTSTVIVCWEDQEKAVRRAVAGRAAPVVVKPRTPLANLDRVTAAQRWADGWRGGLVGSCHFDRGFHAPYVREAVAPFSPSLIVLIDPASALVDPALVDGLIEHAEGHPHREFFFTQAAPGLAGVALRPILLDRLAGAATHPGRLLAYSPDTPTLDPITNDMCVSVPAKVARTTHRFALDSDRQVARVSAATAGLNGELIESDAEALVAALDAYPQSDTNPREVVLELTARRTSRPIFAPGTHLELGRGDLSLESLRGIVGQLRDVDDVRLTLGGAGDPLCHPQFAEALAIVREAGIPAVHVETDLLDLSDAALEKIAQNGVDVLSVHLPAATVETYRRVMGINGYGRVLENLKRVLGARTALPLIVPTFTKCRENLAEMEVWYDQWLRVLGHAVIVGPSDYAGQIPDRAVADMSPPRRRACARLNSRMSVHSDGVVPSCEQDVLAAQPMGHAHESRIGEAWRHGLAVLRSDHEANRLASRPLCAACKEWHRP
jgi:hypothetical protein